MWSGVFVSDFVFVIFVAVRGNRVSLHYTITRDTNSPQHRTNYSDDIVRQHTQTHTHTTTCKHTPYTHTHTHTHTQHHQTHHHTLDALHLMHEPKLSLQEAIGIRCVLTRYVAKRLSDDETVIDSNSVSKFQLVCQSRTVSSVTAAIAMLSVVPKRVLSSWRTPSDHVHNNINVSQLGGEPVRSSECSTHKYSTGLYRGDSVSV